MTNSKIELAREVATKAHEGQLRRDGKPYITHPEAVAKIVEDIFWSYPIPIFGYHNDILSDAIQVALLHDVLEDTQLNEHALTNMQFSMDVVQAIKSISKLDGESYFNFIQRTSYGSHIAMVVKIADLKHNMSDLKEGSQKDKYRFALHFLETKLNTLYD